MPMYDFQCSNGHQFEDICGVNELPVCPECGANTEKVWNKSPPVLVAIIPDYPGSKRFKAGYTHTHFADQNATKVQSGYGGCVNPPN
jgi:putative FmdB family regulatory protein